MLLPRIPVFATLSVLAASPALAQEFEIGSLALTWNDPAQGGKSVPVDVHYPATQPGSGAPVAAGAFPALAFGHGFQLQAASYAWVWEGLVPAGYIVVLPKTGGELFPSHAAFGADLAFVLRELRALGDEPSSPFFGHVAAASAVMGHSMGGGASFLAAEADPDITALVALAPADTTPSAIAAAANVRQPALVFAATNDCVTPPAMHQQPMYDALASPCRSYVEITGGSHCQFETNSFLCTLGELFCGASISEQAQQTLVLQLVTPWLDHVLAQEPGAWASFQGELAASSGFTFQQDCAPVVATVGGLHASLPGAIEVTGAGLDYALTAEVGGAPATIQAQSATALTLDLGTSDPGHFELSLDTGTTSAISPGAVARWPALGAEGAQVGGSFDATLETGGAGFHVLAVGATLGPALELPGIEYELLLPSFAVLAAGVVPADGVAVSTLGVPGDPMLAGAGVFLQSWNLEGTTASGIESFSNVVGVVIQP